MKKKVILDRENNMNKGKAMEKFGSGEGIYNGLVFLECRRWKSRMRPILRDLIGSI